MLINLIKELNKKEVYNMILHEIKNEVLGDYNGVLEMVGSIDLVKKIEKLKSGLEIRKIIKHIRVVFDEGYNADDSIFTRYLFILETPAFHLVNRSGFEKGTGFKTDIIEVVGDNCYIQTSHYCFIKVSNF